MISFSLSLKGRDGRSMDNPEKIWHLIARTLNRESSAEEEAELTEMLKQDESLRQQYDLLARIWVEKKVNSSDENNDAARKTVSRIINKAEFNSAYAEIIPTKKRFVKRRTWMVAASLTIIMATAGWLWINNISPGNVGKQEALEAPKGSRTRTVLPDGTTVWLNAGSKLYYSGDLSGPTREVKLEGEAFFDVVKQPDHPFIVHTSGIDIKVLGTSFNVKSYPEDKTVETTLYRGLVKVFRETESEGSAIELRPNEKLILPKEAAEKPLNLPEESKPTNKKEVSASFTIALIDSTKKESERLETAWLYSRLEFRGDRFEELAKKLERWYNITIIFNDEQVKKLSFNGSFEKETVEEAFEALKSAEPFNYSIKGYEINVGSFK